MFKSLVIKISLKVSYYSNVGLKAFRVQGDISILFSCVSHFVVERTFSALQQAFMQSRNVNLNIMQKTAYCNFRECFIHIPLKKVSAMWPGSRQSSLVAHQFWVASWEMLMATLWAASALQALILWRTQEWCTLTLSHSVFFHWCNQSKLC